MNSSTKASAQADVMSSFAHGVYADKYAMKFDKDGKIWEPNSNEPPARVEEWNETAERVVSHVMAVLGFRVGDYEFDRLIELVAQRKFMPGGRYLYASGRPLHQTQNCLLMRCEDSREGWADLFRKAAMALQTGAGIGVDYSSVRPSGTPIKKTGGVASGPLSPMRILNEIGRNVMQGGARRSAIWAGLHWKHADVFKFINVKDWPEVVVREKEKNFFFPADLDMTNISVILDDEFFAAYGDSSNEFHLHAVEVYDSAVRSMLKTAEPGFSIDIGENAGETLRNACTEVTSRDDSDICNLGSVNLARITSKQEFEEVVKLGTLFLLAGTIYSDIPYPEVDSVRHKNRRLGLGLMGIHEWLLSKGKTYGPDAELAEWLEIYSKSTDYAGEYAHKWGLSEPVKTRAIAPTGTIGIVAETTTGIEPIINAAYKRRVRQATPDGDTIREEFVVDPTAKRLLESGVPAANIEDAYTLSYDIERRIAFQAWVQKYVDHGISSTLNLPYQITEEWHVEDFKETLMKYLPELRGVTVYPDGCRAGQPITPVPLEYALQNEGVVVETNEESCKNGVCGI